MSILKKKESYRKLQVPDVEEEEEEKPSPPLKKKERKEFEYQGKDITGEHMFMHVPTARLYYLHELYTLQLNGEL